MLRTCWQAEEKGGSDLGFDAEKTAFYKASTDTDKGDAKRNT